MFENKQSALFGHLIVSSKPNRNLKKNFSELLSYIRLKSGILNGLPKTKNWTRADHCSSRLLWVCGSMSSSWQVSFNSINVRYVQTNGHISIFSNLTNFLKSFFCLHQIFTLWRPTIFNPSFIVLRQLEEALEAITSFSKSDKPP